MNIIKKSVCAVKKMILLKYERQIFIISNARNINLDKQTIFSEHHPYNMSSRQSDIIFSSLKLLLRIL